MTEQCGSCKLIDKRIEAGGIWHCPNPHCRGVGAVWFRRKLESFEDQGSFHTVCDVEWKKKADEWDNGKWKKEKIAT